MSKYRIVAHGGAYGTWWKIQRKKFFGWETLTDYINSYQAAKGMVANMEEWK